MSLGSYALRRLLQAVPILVGVISLMFVLINLVPGDAAVVLAGEFASPAQVELVRVRYGLDKPLVERWVRFMAAALTGDFGESFAFHEPVMGVVGERIGPTLALVLSAQILSLLLGMAMGFWAALRAGSVLEETASIGAVLLFSFPVFWLGLMAIVVFGVWLGWLPTGGMADVRSAASGMGHMVDLVRHAVLPVATLSLGWFFPQYFRVTRTAVLEASSDDYVRTARAKGLSARIVIGRHVLRNVMLPVVTMTGLWLSLSFSGAVLTETVFSWPGLGRLMYDSIFTRDYPVLMGIFTVTAVMVVVLSVVTDIAYAVVDPRIKLSQS